MATSGGSAQFGSRLAPQPTADPTWQQSAGTMAAGAMGRPISNGPRPLDQGGAALSWGDPNVRAQVPQTPGAPFSPGPLSGPGFGEQYGQSHVGQYDTPTALETFAQQQLNGNNPYYDRLRQQGTDQLNQQMIARGHGNSGGAFAALGNMYGAMNAAQFNDMGNLLGSAGTMGLTRMGQGQNVANSIQNMQQGRLDTQFNQLSDLAHLGAGTVGGFYGQGAQLSGDAAMGGANAGANAAQLTGQGQQALPNLVMSGVNGYLGSKGGK
jgi:hypothetical protein